MLLELNIYLVGLLWVFDNDVLWFLRNVEDVSFFWKFILLFYVWNVDKYRNEWIMVL